VLEAAREASADIAFVDTPPFAKDIAFEAAQRLLLNSWQRSAWGPPGR
jgi:hypothetical protein